MSVIDLEPVPKWQNKFTAFPYGDIDSEVKDRIDQLFGLGWHKFITDIPVKRPRGKHPRGFYKRNAFAILSQITGGKAYSTGPYDSGIDPKIEWLWEKIYDEREFGGTHSNKYTWYMAIAKDAGVWPPPKWYQVTRRLRGLSK